MFVCMYTHTHNMLHGAWGLPEILNYPLTCNQICNTQCLWQPVLNRVLFTWLMLFPQILFPLQLFPKTRNFTLLFHLQVVTISSSERPRGHLEKASAHFPDRVCHYSLDNLILGAKQTQLQGLILNIYAYCMPIHCSMCIIFFNCYQFSLICLINDTSLLSYSSCKSGVWYESHQIKIKMLTGCVPLLEAVGGNVVDGGILFPMVVDLCFCAGYKVRAILSSRGHHIPWLVVPFPYLHSQKWASQVLPLYFSDPDHCQKTSL